MLKDLAYLNYVVDEIENLHTYETTTADSVANAILAITPRKSTLHSSCSQLKIEKYMRLIIAPALYKLTTSTLIFTGVAILAYVAKIESNSHRAQNFRGNHSFSHCTSVDDMFDVRLR